MRTSMLFTLLFACAPQTAEPTISAPVCAVDDCLGEDEASAVLGFVNHRTTSVIMLDAEVGIDIRAAEAIVAQRNGPDGLPSTDDDMLFSHQDELHATAWLGPNGIRALTAWSMTAGWPADDAYVGTYDNVGFTAYEADAVLDYINTTEIQDLAEVIDDRAATTIDKTRPFADMHQLSESWFVGEATLRTLRDTALEE